MTQEPWEKAQKEKALLAVAFDEFSKNLPKSLERDALGDEKMYQAFVPAMRVVFQEAEKRTKEKIIKLIQDENL